MIVRRPFPPAILAALTTVAALAGVAACSSGSGSTSSATSSGPAGSSPASGAGTAGVTQVEVNPAGDIPDNQAYVRVPGQGFTVTVPEGWARQVTGGAITYADKYNSVTLASTAATAAPTVASATSTELPSIASREPRFTAGPVTSVRRTAGSGVLVKYTSLSPVNAVTGKAALRAVERYEFWRAGREAVLTLAAPVGSDNVDPWRKVTDSFRWGA